MTLTSARKHVRICELKASGEPKFGGRDPATHLAARPVPRSLRRPAPRGSTASDPPRPRLRLSRSHPRLARRSLTPSLSLRFQLRASFPASIESSNSNQCRSVGCSRARVFPKARLLWRLSFMHVHIARYGFDSRNRARIRAHFWRVARTSPEIRRQCPSLNGIEIELRIRVVNRPLPSPAAGRASRGQRSELLCEMSLGSHHRGTWAWSAHRHEFSRRCSRATRGRVGTALYGIVAAHGHAPGGRTRAR